MPITLPDINGILINIPDHAKRIYTSRSQIADLHRCPQFRYLSHHHELVPGRPGVQRTSRAVPLVTGSAVHQGLAMLASEYFTLQAEHGPGVNLQAWARNEGMSEQDILITGGFRPEWIDNAVKSALDLYASDLADRGFQNLDSQSGETQWIIAEQRALVEGLIRAAAASFVGQLFSSGHHLLSIEKERTTVLATQTHRPITSSPSTVGLGYTNTYGEPVMDSVLLYQSRADLEMYDPVNQVLYVINWKTNKQFRDAESAKLAIDLQTMGEPMALQAWHKASYDTGGHGYLEFADIPQSAPVAGVQYVIFTKGQHRLDQARGHRVTYNHFTRAWSAVDPSTGDMKYSWLYYYPDSKRQVLSKGSGFYPFESYPGGTKQWMAALAVGAIGPVTDPANPLNTIPTPLVANLRLPAMAYLHPHRLKMWHQQTVRDELAWHAELPMYRDLTVLPTMRTDNCGHAHYKCPMFGYCHEGDYLTSDSYEPRNLNHPTLEEPDED